MTMMFPDDYPPPRPQGSAKKSPPPTKHLTNEQMFPNAPVKPSPVPHPDTDHIEASIRASIEAKAKREALARNEASSSSTSSAKPKPKDPGYVGPPKVPPPNAFQTHDDLIAATAAAKAAPQTTSTKPPVPIVPKSTAPVKKEAEDDSDWQDKLAALSVSEQPQSSKPKPPMPEKQEPITPRTEAFLQKIAAEHREEVQHAMKTVEPLPPPDRRPQPPSSSSSSSSKPKAPTLPTSTKPIPPALPQDNTFTDHQPKGYRANAVTSSKKIHRRRQSRNTADSEEAAASLRAEEASASLSTAAFREKHESTWNALRTIW